MKNIILQHWTGELGPLELASKANMEKYAKQCGAEYELILGNQFHPKLHGCYQKLIMLDKRFDKYQDTLMVDLDMFVEELSVGEKQRVEIIKVLFRGAKILILDEPTAVLVPQEVKELFNNLNNLKQNGVTIIFISHKLDEVIEIADDISVMRGGKLIDTVKNENVSKTEVAEMMIGKSLPTPPPRSTETKQNKILDLKNITSETVDGRKFFTDVSFNVFGSEILGIAGVEGNGQKEVIESIIAVSYTHLTLPTTPYV